MDYGSSISVDIGHLRRGERVALTSVHTAAHYTGLVDEVAPLLGVIWIRDALGDRKLFLTQEWRFYRDGATEVQPEGLLQQILLCPAAS